MPADAPGQKAGKKRKLPPPLPAPCLSARAYARVAPKDIAMFRFLLEAEDNLAYASTVDRWASVVRVTFSPHQEKAVREYLAAMRDRIEFAILSI